MSVSKTNDAVHIVGLWVFLSKEVGSEKERKWKRENKRKREKTEANKYPSNVGNLLFKKCCYLFTKSCPTLLQSYEL